jgi:hypothetical protein
MHSEIAWDCDCNRNPIGKMVKHISLDSVEPSRIVHPVAPLACTTFAGLAARVERMGILLTFLHMLQDRIVWSRRHRSFSFWVATCGVFPFDQPCTPVYQQSKSPTSLKDSSSWRLLKPAFPEDNMPAGIHSKMNIEYRERLINRRM